MKKYLIVLLSLIIVFQCIVVSCAGLYDGDSRYTIDLPEKFSQIGENRFRADDNSEFSVTFEDNKEKQFCVADMSDKDIDEYIATMETESKALLKEVGVDGSIKIISAEKIKHTNGRYALVILLETKYTVEGKTTVKYQKIYGFSCVENKMSFTYTVDDKEKLNDFDESFDSIVVNEKKVESKLDKLTTVATYVGIIIVVLVLVIWFVKRRSR